MARTIDKQTMLDLIIEAKRMDPETGSFSEWLAEYLVDHLPTLTPPNEPLTCEGCLYAPDLPYEVHCRGCARLYTDHYRRPPEGEEDT